MGVEKTIIEEGSGPSPKKGDTVTMEYHGWLVEGDKRDGKPAVEVWPKGNTFDSTEGRGPFQTAIGVGRVIKGWDEGVITMKLNEKARLQITADYAYGERAFSNIIPAHSNLIFEVELKKIN